MKRDSIALLPKRVANVYDIRCLDGAVCLFCRTTGKHVPVLYVGSKKYDLNATVAAPSQFGGFSLFRYGDEVGFRGSFRLDWNRPCIRADGRGHGWWSRFPGPVSGWRMDPMS